MSLRLLQCHHNSWTGVARFQQTPATFQASCTYSATFVLSQSHRCFVSRTRSLKTPSSLRTAENGWKTSPMNWLQASDDTVSVGMTTRAACVTHRWLSGTRSSVLHSERQPSVLSVITVQMFIKHCPPYLTINATLPLIYYKFAFTYVNVNYIIMIGLCASLMGVKIWRRLRLFFAHPRCQRVECSIIILSP